MTDQSLLNPPRRQGAQIIGTYGEIFIYDATTSESHRDSARVTKHPVEIGGFMNDHVVQLPKTPSVTGVVTNTPIVTSPTSLLPRRAQTAYDMLIAMQERGDVVALITGVRVYTSLVITTIEVPRGTEFSSNQLRIQVNFEEVQFEGVSLVDVDPLLIAAAERAAASAAADRGRVAAEETEDQLEEGGPISPLAMITEWIGGTDVQSIMSGWD